MKAERSMLIAFVLNGLFSVFELIGGVVTGSVSIISDAIHDGGDALSIGVSYFLEKKSKQQPDETYTYGYARYSVIGGLMTLATLLIGSLVVLYNAVDRIMNPAEIDYTGMFFFAALGVCVNSCAVLLTGKKGSLNQKAVALHLLEDVLGWVVVLIGALVMKLTNFTLLDPLMSIGVSVFVLVEAVKNMKEIMGLLLEKAPQNIYVAEIKQHIEAVAGVVSAHHIHLWSMDGQTNYATVHVVTDEDPSAVKANVRKQLLECGIHHITVEMETGAEKCCEQQV